MSCYSILKKNGLKLTPQRNLILRIIHDTGSHLTADDIIAGVHREMPGVHKSTIYRTLDMLERTGCVYKSTLHDQSIYHHAEEGHHHHLVCRKCGKTVLCEENIFIPAEQAAERKYGFHIDIRHLVVQGICGTCFTKGDRS